MPTSLDQWKPQLGDAPELRIGIVMPEDGRASVTISDLGTGLSVEGLRAGRGFHWEKTITLRLPGVLEVRPVGDRLMVACRLPVEEYLVGVISSEMSGECPLEFLKAQCVVARSWTLANTERKHADLGIDYCNDDCCQRYQGLDGATDAARRAVSETSGEVLIAPGGELKVVDANYSKSCGGIAEDPHHVWPDIPKPGLSPLVDAPPSSPIHAMYPLEESRLSEFLTGRWLERCDAYCCDRVVPPGAIGRYLGRVDVADGLFRWKVSHGRTPLESLLEKKVFQRLNVPDADRPARLDRLRVTRCGVSGRATQVVFDYLDRSGRSRSFTLDDQYWIRHALHESFLYSSAFLVEETRRGDGALEQVTLVGAGWGHGAGFCQIGGLGMALQGIGYRDILAHYFPTASLRKVHSRVRATVVARKRGQEP